MTAFDILKFSFEFVFEILLELAVLSVGCKWTINDTFILSLMFCDDCVRV
jgi:hypothetical protein